jgi:hypothetical protein
MGNNTKVYMTHDIAFEQGCATAGCSIACMEAQAFTPEHKVLSTSNNYVMS